MPLTHSEITARLRAAGCVFAEAEAELLMAEAKGETELGELVARRVEGLPLEQILGWAEFCGLRVSVAPGVFVPRPRSEFLVQQAVLLAPNNPVVLDLCCGSGALGLALAKQVPGVELYASDVEPAAVECARRNLSEIGGRVLEGDLFSPLPSALKGRVDILLANVPYVPTDKIEFLPSEARVHEPRVTLDGGGDGLDVLRRVAAEAAAWLAPGGYLFIETSERQAPAAVKIFSENGLKARVVEPAEMNATVIIGARPIKH